MKEKYSKYIYIDNNCYKFTKAYPLDSIKLICLLSVIYDTYEEIYDNIFFDNDAKEAVKEIIENKAKIMRRK